MSDNQPPPSRFVGVVAVGATFASPHIRAGLIASIELWSSRTDVLVAWQERRVDKPSIRDSTSRFRAAVEELNAMVLGDDVGSRPSRKRGSGSDLEGWNLMRLSFLPALSSEARFITITGVPEMHPSSIVVPVPGSL